MVKPLSYVVKTQAFEGPLDLLLELINKRKLFINDVSLASVTDDFIRHLEEKESAGLEVPLGESAEFIVIASTLMLIKSRSLLPGIKLTEEEEGSIQDLENRLALYARTKELALNLRSIFGKRIIFEKTPPKNRPVVFSPDPAINIENLLAAIDNIIRSLPKKEALPKVAVKKVISLEEMIGRLAERISKATKLSFKEFHSTRGALTHEKKVSIIVGFLAMLELVKRGAIRVRQEGRGDIEIESGAVSTPAYL